MVEEGAITVDENGVSLTLADAFWAFVGRGSAWCVLAPARCLSWSLSLNWRLWPPGRLGPDGEPPSWPWRLGVRAVLRDHQVTVNPDYCYVGDRNLTWIRYLWGGRGRT